MVDGDRASVIDWTDAGLGPRETDVARTALIFHIAAIAADGAVERAVLKLAGPRLSRRYLKTYEAGARLDPDPHAHVGGAARRARLGPGRDAPRRRLRRLVERRSGPDPPERRATSSARGSSEAARAA